jgi:hypothetical protein
VSFLLMISIHREFADFHWIDVLLHVLTNCSICRAAGRKARICSFLHFRDVMPLLFDIISYPEYADQIKKMLNLLLGCHSERILHIFGKLDYSGIALLTMGSFVPWVYYTFYCETQSKIVYMGIIHCLVRRFINILVTISLLAVISVILSQWDRFARPEYRAIRAGVFLSLGLSGVIPMIHALIKNGAKCKLDEALISRFKIDSSFVWRRSNSLDDFDGRSLRRRCDLLCHPISG